MREERGLFLNDSLYASKRSLPDRHRNYPQARLQDDFARRVKMPAPRDSFPPFSHLRRKGGAVCQWHTNSTDRASRRECPSRHDRQGRGLMGVYKKGETEKFTESPSHNQKTSNNHPYIFICFYIKVGSNEKTSMAKINRIWRNQNGTETTGPLPAIL